MRCTAPAQAHSSVLVSVPDNQHDCSALRLDPVSSREESPATTHVQE